MNSLVIPGLQFYAEAMSCCVICTEPRPQKNELYVVCTDGSIQSVYNPKLSIEWELFEEDDTWYYKSAQDNHTPKRCLVRFHGIASTIPAGREYKDEPQNAEAIFQMDNDPEVSSY